MGVRSDKGNGSPRTTYEGPASMTKIFHSGFSASRDATTPPAVPPAQSIETRNSGQKFCYTLPPATMKS